MTEANTFWIAERIDRFRHFLGLRAGENSQDAVDAKRLQDVLALQHVKGTKEELAHKRQEILETLEEIIDPHGVHIAGQTVEATSPMLRIIKEWHQQEENAH